MFKIAAIALAITAVFASATVVLARQASGPYIQSEASYPTGNESPNATYVAPRIAPIRSAPVLPFTWAEKRAFDRAIEGSNH
jgi:hypothetical protein